MNNTPVISRRAAARGGRAGSGADRRHPAAGADAAAEADADADARDCHSLWSICLTIAARRRASLPPCAFTGDAGEDAAGLAPGHPTARVHWDPAHGWMLNGNWSRAAHDMFMLYRPLLELAPAQRFLIGHLGQSIDGRVATVSGDSCFINGQQNLEHLHRLRALCDAVLVGAATVVADDPQLTTRLVSGPDPARVVLDPSRRLTAAHRICSDGTTTTLLARYPRSTQERCGRAEIIAAKRTDQGMDLAALLDALSRRGLHVIFVEGGGITVSRFLEQGLLHRLQIAIAPLIIGSGRQGLQLPEVMALNQCLRPPCRQIPMGEDTLWDLDLSGTA